jgi:hypothetical protein
MELTYKQKKDIRKALQSYIHYRKNVELVDEISYGILNLLEEGDVIEAYLDGLKKEGTRTECYACIRFLSGASIEKIAKEKLIQERGFSRENVFSWINGNQTKMGLVGYIMDKFLELSDYCEFCDNNRLNTSNKVVVPSPLHGKVCPKCGRWFE